jgi:hypothetical protein
MTGYPEAITSLNPELTGYFPNLPAVNRRRDIARDEQQFAEGNTRQCIDRNFKGISHGQRC